MKTNMPSRLTNEQEEILIGTLLGDACLYLPNENGNPYLSIKRKLEDRRYLEWQANFFLDFTRRPVHETTYTSSKPDPKTRKLVKYKYTAVQFVSRCAPAFLPFRTKWYPNGEKVVPKDLQLSPLIMAEWFCDDGCVSVRKNGSSIKLELSVMSFSDNDIDFLKNLLESQFDEKFCVDKKRVLYCSDAPARLFLKEIDDIFPPGMERKLLWRRPKIEFYSKEIGQSRLKRQEEIQIKIVEFLKTHNQFMMIELAQYTGCIYEHHGKLEPDYETLKKYLKGYSLIKKGKLYENNTTKSYT